MRELSHHILDIVENALEAGATHVEVRIVEDSKANRLTIEIADNGRGMDPETLARVGDPFFTTRTTRHVGLGIPLFKAAAERCNGSVRIHSIPGMGTRILADFERDHIDRAPLGDMVSTLMGILLARSQCRLTYCHQLDDRTFAFDTQEIHSILGDLSLSHPRVRAWIQEFLEKGEKGLYRVTF